MEPKIELSCLASLPLAPFLIEAIELTPSDDPSQCIDTQVWLSVLRAECGDFTIEMCVQHARELAGLLEKAASIAEAAMHATTHDELIS